ncbi:hypothetical protein AVEN_181714-1 [Araneus ventricosus]|uniref:Uncharacterized protein n=1 Tax=Araneus ventricosus TaxID=182803 RepID=A0A4Y2EC40_ARAVE|nr:hypothetical protein AVEN_181714-1 [Araneus ventricosus]
MSVQFGISPLTSCIKKTSPYEKKVNLFFSFSMFSPMSIPCPISKSKNESYNYYTCQLGLPPAAYPPSMFPTSAASTSSVPFVTPLKNLSSPSTSEADGVGPDKTQKLSLSFAE